MLMFTDNRPEIVSRLKYWVAKMDDELDQEKVRAMGLQFGSEQHLIRIKATHDRIRLLTKVLEKNLENNP